MNFRFLREIKITLPLLCLTGVMFAGTLATWSYALVLNGNVKAAMKVPEQAEEAEAAEESGESTEEARTASPRPTGGGPSACGRRGRVRRALGRGSSKSTTRRSQPFGLTPTRPRSTSRRKASVR